MVCGGDRVLFVAATKDGNDVRRCWAPAMPPCAPRNLAGWAQFDADLKTYVPRHRPAPERSLPARTCLRPWCNHHQIALKDKLRGSNSAAPDPDKKLEPKTDQDFADAGQPDQGEKAACENHARLAQMRHRGEPSRSHRTSEKALTRSAAEREHGRAAADGREKPAKIEIRGPGADESLHGASICDG